MEQKEENKRIMKRFLSKGQVLFSCKHTTQYDLIVHYGIVIITFAIKQFMPNFVTFPGLISIKFGNID